MEGRTDSKAKKRAAQWTAEGGDLDRVMGNIRKVFGKDFLKYDPKDAERNNPYSAPMSKLRETRTAKKKKKRIAAGPNPTPEPTPETKRFYNVGEKVGPPREKLQAPPAGFTGPLPEKVEPGRTLPFGFMGAPRETDRRGEDLAPRSGASKAIAGKFVQPEPESTEPPDVSHLEDTSVAPNKPSQGESSLLSGMSEEAKGAWLRGATPLLVGLLSGNMGDAYEIAGKGLMDEFNYARKKETEDRAFTRNKELVSAKGKKSFNLESKKKLAAFKSRLKKKENKFKDTTTLRKEWSKDPITQNSKDIVQSYQKIQDILSAPQTGPGDLSLIFAYMKMLDPASVVREGEQITARKTGKISENLWQHYQRLVQDKDAFLPGPVRTKFGREARRIHRGQVALQSQVDKTYQSLAKSRGLDSKQVTVHVSPTQQAVIKETANGSTAKVSKQDLDDVRIMYEYDNQD